MASSSEAPKVKKAILDYMGRRSNKKLTAGSPSQIAEHLGLSDMSGNSLVTVLTKLRADGVIRYHHGNEGHVITLGSGRAQGRGRKQGQGRKRK